VDAFKMFFTQKVIEIIICRMNTYVEQCIKSRVNVSPLRLWMRDWKPVTADAIYVVLALFMLIGIVQKPTLHSYFLRNSVLATPVFGSVISMNQFKSISKFMHIKVKFI
jgi:uncharacterized membrane protein